ncbi:MAG: uracil-DNA glycosylase [Caldimonas sp.]
MGWTERQRAMLAEMGIRLWVPETLPASAPGDVDTATRETDGKTASSASATPRAASASDEAVAVVVARTDLPRAPASEPNSPDQHRAADDIARLDADALAARAAACTLCALCAGRTRSVFGHGSLQADWMVVGDAPDADDDAAGEPFAGRAGQLLDNMLAALRLSRGEAPRAGRAYVTPSVKCRPPAGRVPEPGEIERCRPYLVRQVALVRPRLIIAMGRVAAQAVVGTAEPAARLRGRVHRFEGVPVVVTYAPAHLLRHPQDKAAAWEDLCLALEVAHGSDSPQSDPA